MRLIDADALENSLGAENEDGYVRELLKDAPAVPAVPLDKLCELLERFAAMDCGGCREAFGSCEVSVCNSRERWKAMLTKWMEGLDAEVH